MSFRAFVQYYTEKMLHFLCLLATLQMLSEAMNPIEVIGI